MSLLLNVPEGAIAVFATVSVCYYADASKKRMVPCIMAVVPTIIGTVFMVGFASNEAKFKAALLVGIMLVRARSLSPTRFCEAEPSCRC
jgi:hypothetical protein